MEKIGFVGAYDKTDFILYIAKILTVIGRRVLVVDATITQKAKYVVPVINPTTTYITQYEDFDVAVGFRSFEDMSDYLGIEDVQRNYDIALVDVDSGNMFNSYEMESADKNYFVTSFDLYSLKKGLEALGGIQNTVPMKKILFAKDNTPQENEYLDFLSRDYNILWNEEIIYFPIDKGDLANIIENQITSKIKFRYFSEEYMNALSILAQEITNISFNDLRKVFKAIEKNAYDA